MRYVKHVATVAAAALYCSPAAAVPLGDIGDFVGNAGFGTPNGNVVAPPVGTGYVFLSTDDGEFIDGLGTGFEATGTELTTDPFTVEAGETLEYFFNYVTSDGSGFPDYAYAFLIDVDTSEETLFFTARTTPEGNTVPGFDLPPLDSAATLTPSTTEIIDGDGSGGDGGPEWSFLGDDSGSCFLGVGQGCGFTDWIFASLEVPGAGTFQAVFGVVNANDTAFQSGLALAGLTAGDVIIIPPDVSDGTGVIPLPAAGWLLGLGIAGLGWTARRRRG